MKTPLYSLPTPFFLKFCPNPIQSPPRPHSFCYLISLAKCVIAPYLICYLTWWYYGSTFVESWYLGTRSTLLCQGNSDLISHTQTHIVHRGLNRLTQTDTYKFILTPPITCSPSSFVYYNDKVFAFQTLLNFRSYIYADYIQDIKFYPLLLEQIPILPTLFIEKSELPLFLGEFKKLPPPLHFEREGRRQEEGFQKPVN